MSDINRISIWDAKNNLKYQDPLKPDDPLYVDISPARGDFSLQRLYREFNIDNHGQAHTPPAKLYTLFTGHLGCGKSTELLQVARYLNAPTRYYVVHLDCLEKLDINNLNYSDVLLALAAALFKQLENEDRITLAQVHLTRLQDWFREKIETHAKTKDLAMEIKAGAKTEAGIPFLSKMFAELTNKISIGSTHREELRLVVRDSFSEFAESFNALIRAAEEQIREHDKGQRILFTVDGTDRLDSDDGRRFFMENVHQLTLIQSLFIICAPIRLLHTDSQLNASFGQPFRVPMLKIRDKNNQKIEENYELVRKLVYRRVPEYLFDSTDTLDYLICYSGGHPRDLLRLLNVSITYADSEQIDRPSAERAVKQVANEYRRNLTQQDYTRLVQIDSNPETPDDFTDDQSSRMLYNLMLLEYNDYFWKSHPLVSSLSGYDKALEEYQDRHAG